jgi:5-methylcytosine-specific restriction protein B
MAEHDCWDLAGRDVIPDLGVQGAPRDVGAALLYALLLSDRSEWKPPYDDVRRNLGIRQKAVLPELQEQADSRIRTYKKLFEGLGLMYEDSGVLHVTPLGERLQVQLGEMFGEVDEAATGISSAARWRLARLGAVLISRYQLRNPATEAEYPSTTDIFPLWAILRAMRSLDDKLHWEEVGRVLTKCLRMDEVPTAIERIGQARAHDDYDPGDPVSAETYLGERKPDLHDDQQDRIIVWLSRAGFKDLLIEHRNRSDGYRYLNEEFVSVVDELLGSSPTQLTFASNADYVKWLGSEPESAAGANDIVAQIVDRCRSHGDRFLIALVGPAGTGKTRYAEEAAKRLVDGDASRWESIQFHAAFTYEEFIGGLAPTEDGGFMRKRGVLLNINQRALESDLLHVLVVDELSRADIANVLGELLTYVEYRGRPFLVAALGDEVVLAENLVVIATLNPSDRSVVNLDDAVVRRLRQIPIPRDPDALRDILNEAGMATGLRDQLVAWFESLPSDAPFGHGLFVGAVTEQDLHELWHEQLRYFLRRGELTTYPNPHAIEAGFVWRDARYSGSRSRGAAGRTAEESGMPEAVEELAANDR